jgi:16S rRNA C967 or C1407 C5-methylase (RsmB/RsmF family)/NOL1/NOP2/fmu family ribosome biogenesis protein
MNLPETFSVRMKSILGEEYDSFQQSFDQEIATTIRINSSKYSEKTRLKNVPFCDTGFFLPQRPLFTLDPFIHSGVYYVQECSSMFLEQAIKQLNLQEGIKVLDLCASPGGKSTHLSSLLPHNSLLVSNDVIRSRSQILSENLKKWGAPSVIVTNNDPHDFQRLLNFFDLIVIDAPCSGEGLFRRDPNAIEEWSPENAQLCAKRQQRILADVWPSLKEGGILIYSTCTFNPEENEKNIEWINEFADINPIKLELSPEWGITQTQAGAFPCYRFYPHKVTGEGFFMAVVQKSGNNDGVNSRRIKDNPLWASKVEKEMGRKLINDQNLEILKFEDSLLAFPVNDVNELLHIKNNLRIVHAGIKIGEIKQKDLLPAHELALSTILNRGAFSEIQLDLEQALNYLKRDEILPVSSNKGWNLLTYRNIALGWVKNLGNRYNSAFPKEWRIRMSIAEYRGENLQQEVKKFPL